MTIKKTPRQAATTSQVADPGNAGSRGMAKGDVGSNPTKPHVPQELRRETNRAVSAGAGKHRGDRRDMSPTYTNNTKHASRGNTARPDVKTRKR